MGHRYGIHTVVEYPSGYPRLTLESLGMLENEAKELLREGNYIEACEKYYKISEEIVKALGEFLAPRTMEMVRVRIMKGLTPWTTILLNRAVDEIIENAGWRETTLERIFRDGWSAAIRIHREGFHDFELTPAGILNEVRKIKDMISIARSILSEYEDHLTTSAP